MERYYYNTILQAIVKTASGLVMNRDRHKHSKMRMSA
jgi:hypothetical protein